MTTNPCTADLCTTGQTVIDPSRWRIAELLPHAGPAIFIDRICRVETDSLTALTIVRPGTAYSDEDGNLPPWLGLEIMAQAVGAWAGVHARLQGRAVELGFLVGSRHYECFTPALLAGCHITADVTRTLDAGGMAVFECTLTDQATVLLARARINVFRPPDVAAFIQETQ